MITMQSDVGWSTKPIISKRDKYYAASQRAFVPYEKSLILKKDKMQHCWGGFGNKMTDLRGINLCISIGYAHPAGGRGRQSAGARADGIAKLIPLEKMCRDRPRPSYHLSRVHGP